ncbi:hypothetical protein [Thiocystis violascens]|uniref:Uncharacterized protein n=1 Tax=Thiocystis violascens (strain ATCC 17096 / DSM 198 / 6111) TaxID=765911 RepID=I3YCG8_THIV6|nr:hypothetical protein [Thiocystis violascens]AFL74686.1 hypothetical protein Thivi_2768 [Thiocystis violascens DSM 198]
MDDMAHQTATISSGVSARDDSRAEDQSASGGAPNNLFAKPLEATQEMVDSFFKLQSKFAGHEAAFSKLWLDWWNQSESMFLFWTDAQRQLIDSWRQGMNGFFPLESDSASGSATTALGSWRSATSQALHLQNEWLRLCVASFGEDRTGNTTKARQESDLDS